MPKVYVKHYILIISSVFLLTACQSGKETVNDVSDAVSDTAGTVKDGAVEVATVAKDNTTEAGQHLGALAHASKEHTYMMMDHLTGWLTPDEKPVPQAIAGSYCYHALQDILCYRQPMPGWEDRLVAYQGTGVPAPAPAKIKLLAKPTVDPSTLPENRVAAAKPVFTTLPVLPKEKEKGSDQPQVIDSSHEQLPDPALAPQL